MTLTDGRTRWEVACDYLACGFGLVPGTELARALGCRVTGGVVEVDERQETTVAGVFCAGESTGIGGVDKAIVEGEIAGWAAIGADGGVPLLVRQRERARAFARSLDEAFALRDELKGLPRAETIVCRCEDVTFGEVAGYESARAGKLQTRCGMGPCQGRVCGSAMAFLRGWTSDSGRPPLFPARVGSLTGFGTVASSGGADDGDAREGLV